MAGGLELGGGDRVKYERGYSSVVGPEAVGVRHVVPPPPPPPPLATQQGHGEDQLRVRFGGGLPGPRVPSAGTKRRSESYEGVGRKGTLTKSSKYRGGVRPQYNQVHALILTWAFHDLRAEDYTAPPAADYVSLEQETARLRATLERYGYAVHEFLIPMARSAEALKAKLKQFCRYAADDTLLVVYYHGHGAMDADNELVFSSHDHPENAEWSKAAAADLYAALLSGDVCSTHGRRDKYQDLLKKYERYRPVSTLKWADTLRTPLLSTPCDVLLILDCCAAGRGGLSHINWQPPAGAAGYTKHLFAACGFESSTSDDMTAAMCAVLDEWVPPPSSSNSVSVSRSRSKSRSKSADGGVAAAGGGRGEGVVVGGGAGGPVGGGQFLTTKRLHQLMEDRLQKRAVGSQPIFKQLLPQDPEQYITLPNLRRREREGEGKGDRRGRRGYVLA
ncbi:hypothetical protein NEMBOFW57_000094 [Staphylotrichum longicolle]|uniref:Uncharacterized protein n=1 Tax=Staphylotrichum longicolle TaxID=669026 RepID=A0AAD4EZ01_9PEZI|nr:hypothetical protein NEMBOFW57_000094 [Staphylotrichum longicolle]